MLGLMSDQLLNQCVFLFVCRPVFRGVAFCATKGPRAMAVIAITDDGLIDQSNQFLSPYG